MASMMMGKTCPARDGDGSACESILTDSSPVETRFATEVLFISHLLARQMYFCRIAGLQDCRIVGL